MIQWGEYLKNFANYNHRFMQYLEIERNASEHTIKHYERDLTMFKQFLVRESINDDFSNIDQRVVRTFLTYLYERNLSRRSVSRTISCLKSFYKFLERENIVSMNPFHTITLPK